jgi:hypothetical protein
MKRIILMTAVLAGLGLAGARWVEAETTNKPPAAHSAAPADSSGGIGEGMKMGGSMMMGGGMMGGGMMGGGMCPMMGGADTQMTVKNVDKGVTITLTSSDPAKVTRLRKMAEAMRLMHEANTQ